MVKGRRGLHDLKEWGKQGGCLLPGAQALLLTEGTFFLPVQGNPVSLRPRQEGACLAPAGTWGQRQPGQGWWSQRTTALGHVGTFPAFQPEMCQFPHCTADPSHTLWGSSRSHW